MGRPVGAKARGGAMLVSRVLLVLLLFSDYGQVSEALPTEQELLDLHRQHVANDDKWARDAELKMKDEVNAAEQEAKAKVVSTAEEDLENVAKEDGELTKARADAKMEKEIKDAESQYLSRVDAAKNQFETYKLHLERKADGKKVKAAKDKANEVDKAMKQEMISKQAARNKEINDFRTLSIKDKDEVHKLEVEERARVTSIKEEFANEISKDPETEQQMKAASLKANQLQLQAAGDAKRIAEEQLENPDKPASSVDTAAEMASDGSPGPADTRGQCTCRGGNTRRCTNRGGGRLGRGHRTHRAVTDGDVSTEAAREDDTSAQASDSMM